MGGLFGSKTVVAPVAPVTVPVIPEPTVMPAANDVVAKKVKKKSLIQQKRRGGRVSTILSATDKLG